MVLQKWNSEKTTKFISLYRAQECLWKIDDLMYRDKEARDTALCKIIAGMRLNLTLDDVKRKIKYLRSTYMVEVNKIEKSLRSPTGKLYKPCLSWFNEMDTFIKHVQLKRSTQNSPTVQQNFNDFEGITHVITELNSSEADKTKTETKQEVKDSHKRREDGRGSTTPIKKRSRIRLSSVVNDMKVLSEEIKRKDKNPSEFEVFGKYIGIQLESLLDEDAIVAQEEIQSIITRYKLKKLRHNCESPYNSSNTQSQISDYQYLVSPTDVHLSTGSSYSDAELNDETKNEIIKISIADETDLTVNPFNTENQLQCIASIVKTEIEDS